MIIHTTGDLLAFTDWNTIAHVCNCQKTMASGVAKAIRDRYPAAYEAYMAAPMDLGTFSVAILPDGKRIVNLLAQYRFGYDGKRYVDYEALYSGLEALKAALEAAATEGRSYKLGVPYKMASERAGGDFRIVEAMLTVLFHDSPIDCYIVHLP